MAEKKQLDDLRIGDFSRPPVEAAGTTKAALEGAEKRLDAEAAIVEAELKPLVSYEEKLKDAGVTKEQAASVVNSIMTKGFWSEEIKVTTTMRARFRTRSKKDTTRAQAFVEQQRPQYESHYAELLTHSLLAASLEQFGSDKFEHPGRKASDKEVEAAYQDRYAYVENLADPVYRLLATKLVAFDRKVAIVLEEGTIENF